MSTTLTNGLKLPDKGSVDWYADMQNNYTILDGAVGTVAEHTTALAGKAPAVHTHTKSDITDLFNSANEWTDLQFYTQSIKFKVNLTIGAVPSSEIYGGFNFGNTGTNIGNVTARVSNAGATYTRLYIGNKFANGALDPNGTWKYAELQVGLRANGDRFIYTDGLWRNSLTPYDSNVSIGDSTHQWNNLYAKNYYYNGVAWGLDKANVWTGNNSYTGTVSLDSSSDVAEQFKQKLPKDVSASNDTMARVNSLVDSAGHYVVVETIGHWSNSVAKNITLKYKNDSTKQGVVEFRLYSDGSGIFYPQSPFGCDLGNIYNKWKSFNGVNPGALSIFNPSATYDPIDIPSTWNTSGTSWNALNVSNLGDGWICITYNTCSAGDYILARFGGTSGTSYPSLRFEAVKDGSNKYYIYALFPVAKAFGNIYLEMLIGSNANLIMHHYIPSYGTV